MNWLLEAQSAVRGTWRLFLRDTGGYDDLDLSERGFWHSFAAIIPIAPLYLYAATITTADELEELAKQTRGYTGRFLQPFFGKQKRRRTA